MHQNMTDVYGLKKFPKKIYYFELQKRGPQSSTLTFDSNHSNGEQLNWVGIFEIKTPKDFS